MKNTVPTSPTSSSGYFVAPPETYHGYTIGLQKVRDVVVELKAIHAAHWRETEASYVAGAMNVDYESFLDAERAARFVLFTVRDDGGQVVGNLAYSLGFSQHQKGKMLAEEKAFFIAEPHRRGGLALKLLGYAEGVLRSLGVNCITMTDKSPAGGTSVEPLVRRRGYVPASLTYVKELED